MSYKLWDFFKELQTDYELVDLTHPLDNDSPYWSGIPAAPSNSAKSVSIGATPCSNA